MPEIDRSEACHDEADLERDGCNASGWQFRIAVMRHRSVVYRVALSLLRDAHEAEDVAQDAFLAYWRHGKTIERPREWLLAVARNACLDRLRRAKLCWGTPIEEPSDERDPAWHAQHRELSEQLQNGIGALPEPQRSLVVLYDIHGLDGAACGRILELSATQVRVYLHRARRRLRRELEDS